MSKSKEYQHVKNFIHNDLSISREYVYELTNKAVKEQVSVRIKEYMESNEFQQMVLSSIGLVLGYRLPLNHIGGNKFSESLQREVKSEVQKIVSEKLDVMLLLNTKP